MEIGLGKGKKNYDKRESIKERETDRDIKRKYGIQFFGLLFIVFCSKCPVGWNL